jgi:hypothetical protein
MVVFIMKVAQKDGQCTALLVDGWETNAKHRFWLMAVMAL